ncbi:MAG: hypothetical protein ACFFD2_14075 [Promethearchaeota archaeon]
MKESEWTCPQCNTPPYRDVNTSENIRKEGLRILRETNIKVIRKNGITVGTTIYTFGEEVRLMLGPSSLKNYEVICL